MTDRDKQRDEVIRRLVADGITPGNIDRDAVAQVYICRTCGARSERPFANSANVQLCTRRECRL